MTSQKVSMGPGGALGYVCPLPIPCLNGKPTDIRAMNIDALQKFIHFMYKSASSSRLPNSLKSRNVKDVPEWWPESITFDRFLTLKGLASGNQRLYDQHKHQLEELIRACYRAHGMSSLLAVGTELSNRKTICMGKDSKGSSSKVVDGAGRTVVIVDSVTLLYDDNHGRRLRDRSSIGGDCSDGAESENGTENSSETGSIRSSKRSSSSVSVSDYQSYEHNRPKQSTSAHVTAKPVKTSNKIGKKSKKATKRKLFESEDISDGKDCKYCAKSFRFAEFCEDHEESCDKAPKPDTTLQGFMNSLGLRDRSQMAAANQLIPRSSQPGPELAASAPVRSLRKLPKRNQLLNLIRNHPLTILTSERGKKMTAEFGATAEKSFPPPYEEDCDPLLEGSTRKGRVKDVPNVMKKAVAKDGKNAHVYSFGRKQRLEHYQELVIGLNHRSWEALNKCKEPRLVLEKIKPTHGTFQLGDSVSRKTHLERQVEVATKPTCVQITDFRKLTNPDPIIANFLAKEKERKEEEKELPPSDNNSPCSSSDSTETLFLPVKVTLQRSHDEGEKE